MCSRQASCFLLSSPPHSPESSPSFPCLPSCPAWTEDRTWELPRPWTLMQGRSCGCQTAQILPFFCETDRTALLLSPLPLCAQTLAGWPGEKTFCVSRQVLSRHVKASGGQKQSRAQVQVAPLFRLCWAREGSLPNSDRNYPPCSSCLLISGARLSRPGTSPLIHVLFRYKNPPSHSRLWSRRPLPAPRFPAAMSQSKSGEDFAASGGIERNRCSRLPVPASRCGWDRLALCTSPLSGPSWPIHGAGVVAASPAASFLATHSAQGLPATILPATLSASAPPEHEPGRARTNTGWPARCAVANALSVCRLVCLHKAPTIDSV